MGIIIKDTVAANFINGPIGVKGSNGNKANVPITQHNKPDFGPKIRKQQIHNIDTGSSIAIPQPGIRGINGVVNAESTKDKAPNKAAPVTSRVNRVLLDIKVYFSSEDLSCSIKINELNFMIRNSTPFFKYMEVFK